MSRLGDLSVKKDNLLRNNMTVIITLQPSVSDFGWVLDFGPGDVRPATTWYSPSHGQLVISNFDMSRLPEEHIRLIEEHEERMINHIAACEAERHLRPYFCTDEQAPG